MAEFIDDILQLKDVQNQTAIATAKLANSMENISSNLDRGFRLGEKIVALFGKIVFVFLATVAALCLVVIYIAKMDISYDTLKIQAGNTAQSSAKPPEVSFGPPAPPSVR